MFSPLNTSFIVHFMPSSEELCGFVRFVCPAFPKIFIFKQLSAMNSNWLRRSSGHRAPSQVGWLMSKALQELRVSRRSLALPPQVRQCPSIPLTGAGFGNAKLHKGFRSVQKGPTDPKAPWERQGTTVQCNARCYDEARTAWYACTSGFEAHLEKKTNLKSRLNTYFTRLKYLSEIFL